MAMRIRCALCEYGPPNVTSFGRKCLHGMGNEAVSVSRNNLFDPRAIPSSYRTKVALFHTTF